jgi:hypothetical protein
MTARLPDSFISGGIIYADDGNQMLAERKGDILPIDPTTRDYSNSTHNLGSSTYKFNNGFFGGYVAQEALRAMVYLSADTSTASPVNWDAVSYDNANFFNIASPSKLTIPVTGGYLIEARLQRDDANPSGNQFLKITKNGVVAISYMEDATNAGVVVNSVQGFLPLVIGDYIELANSSEFLKGGLDGTAPYSFLRLVKIW